MSSTKPIRAAVIGCGHIGTQHAQFLAQTSRSTLKWVADVSADAVRQLAEATGTSATTDPEDIFRDPEVDAVWICTHHDSHRSLAIRAAEAGKDVFIEKPLALTIEDATAIVEAVETAGVRATTGFKFRHYPAVILARSFMPKPLMTLAHVVDDEWPEGHWANDPTRGGGNVLSEGVHILDLVSHLHRGPPVRLYAEGGRLMHTKAFNPDHAVITLTFPEGAIAAVAIGESGQPPLTSKFGIQMSDGRRSLNLHHRLTALEMRGPEGNASHHDPGEVGIEAIDAAFLDALIHGTTPSCTARDGLRATALVLAAFESMNRRTPIDLTRPPFVDVMRHPE
ncbi:MAG: Gfo/Idh/MocA family oxidoreductase [Opitutaceae bacterium]